MPAVAERPIPADQAPAFINGRSDRIDISESDRVALQPGQTAPVEPVAINGKTTASAVQHDPKNDVDERKREIGLLEPTRAVMTISRDGISATGDVHPQTGEGVEALREQLAHKIEQQRAPAGRPAVIPMTTTADLLALRRTAAAQMGHNIVETPGSKSLRCKNCGKPEVLCLDGQPCVTRPLSVTVADEAQLARQ
jgi:hypothetical protein